MAQIYALRSSKLTTQILTTIKNELPRSLKVFVQTLESNEFDSIRKSHQISDNREIIMIVSGMVLTDYAIVDFIRSYGNPGPSLGQQNQFSHPSGPISGGTRRGDPLGQSASPTMSARQQFKPTEGASEANIMMNNHNQTNSKPNYDDDYGSMMASEQLVDVGNAVDRMRSRKGN